MNQRRLLQRTAGWWVALVLASSAFGQVDGRALELLEGLLASASTEVVDSLEQTMIVSLTEQGMEVRTRTYVDYVGRRALIETQSMGVAISFVVTDAGVFVNMMGRQLPAPPGIAPDLSGIFERDVEALDLTDRTATYDGTVSYGSLVTGEQVTLSGPSLVPYGSEGSETARYLFDGSGLLVAVVSESEGVTVLMVFDEPVDANPGVGRNGTIYDISGGGSAELGTVRFENVIVNGPAPDGVF